MQEGQLDLFSFTDEINEEGTINQSTTKSRTTRKRTTNKSTLKTATKTTGKSTTSSKQTTKKTTSTKKITSTKKAEENEKQTNTTSAKKATAHKTTKTTNKQKQKTKPKSVVLVYDKEIANHQEKTDELKKHLRLFPSVEIGDKVKIAQPIDNDPENRFYFDKYKNKKGTVVDMKQTPHPKSYLYQYNVWVEFSKDDIGIFYDLELEIIP